MSTLTLSLLRILSDGAFHSGEALAQQLGLSRTRIWQAMQAAETLGVQVFKVKGRGYQLAQPIEWLERQMIYSHMSSSAQQAVKLNIVEQVESTNSMLMQTLAQADVHRQCLAAEIQTRGRGRRGRQWHGGLGGSLMFSLAWRFNLGISELSGLSLAVGLALARGLQELNISQVQLKWPNDLVHNFCKLGGVLIEIQGDALGPSHAVIGIGLNVYLPAIIKNKIDQAAVDLQSISDTQLSRNQVLATMLSQLLVVLTEFDRHGFAALRAEWEALHAYHEKFVALCMPDGADILGKVRGVTDDGALILETAHGERRFGSGELSLRPASILNVA